MKLECIRMNEKYFYIQSKIDPPQVPLFACLPAVLF